VVRVTASGQLHRLEKPGTERDAQFFHASARPIASRYARALIR
jgi:hypothetical protein